MIRTKIKCELCGQEISKSNYTKHIRRHNLHPESFKISSYIVNHEGLECQFCNKVCKNANSLRNHERTCKQNPNRMSVRRDGFNDFGRTAWNKGLTKETDERVKSQSLSLKKWYKEHPEHISGGYIPTSARKCKYGTYKGFYCDSGWELAFVIYHLDNNSHIARCTENFEYMYENKKHMYYPDFIIDGKYYEIKGIYRPEDITKIEQFPTNKKLIVIDSNNIDIYIKYCESRYGKNYTELYDREYPSWMDNEYQKDYNFKIKQAHITQMEE